MKKKEIIIIFLAIILLICINSLYFIVPVSYAGTSEKNYIGVLDKHKLILPTEAQASLIKKGMSMKEVLDTIGLPQKNYGSGIYIFEFHLRDGHRLWIYTFGDVVWIIEHSDYPYQTHEDYLKRRREEKEDASAVTPWNNMYGAAANSLPDAA